MEKIRFESKSLKELLIYLKSNKQRKILNFLNLHDLYHFNNSLFKKSILEEPDINFLDGFINSLYLSIKNLKKISRLSGPTVTRGFLSKKDLLKNKKHLFIGLEREDLKVLDEKFPYLKNTLSYNPKIIKGLNFSKKEIKTISNLINKNNINYIWVGIGSPKQNILSSELFKKTSPKYFLNVGAALDFILGKKIEAPTTIKKLGIEWLYRLITDFKHTNKKVWRSFIGLRNLNKITLR
tara:strand:- start:13 stop:726 length:714 start_codon:yes stop_codon:yes gene_type:complete